MRKQLCWAVTLGVAAVIGIAGLAVAANKATVVRAGNLILAIDGGVTPEALPKDVPAPIGFHETSGFSTVDGSQLPGLKDVVLDIDRDVFIDVKGLPVCHESQLQAQDTAHAAKACSGAILGKGNATVRVAFPEQAPFDSTGPLVLFNGGEKGGVTTFFVHAYVDVPAPTAIVTKIEVAGENKGSFGLHATVSVPVIAGGAGAVIHTELSGRRVYTYKGKQHSVFSARCSHGHFLVRGTFDFRDDTAITGDFLTPCVRRAA